MRNKSTRSWMRGVAVFLSVCALAGVVGQAWAAETLTLSLEECMEIAMEQNHSRPASRFAVAAAEAQHQQAKSGYWPQITLKGAYELMDEPLNYLFPASTFTLPPMSLAVPGGSFQTPGTMITIPANAFGPGSPPGNVQMPVPSQSIQVPGQNFTIPGSPLSIPEQNTKLDRESWYASLEAQWLLWDGGMRSGLRQQAQAGLDAAREELRRTDLQIMDSVTRLYYGAVMAGQIRDGDHVQGGCGQGQEDRLPRQQGDGRIAALGRGLVGEE